MLCVMEFIVELYEGTVLCRSLTFVHSCDGVADAVAD